MNRNMNKGLIGVLFLLITYFLSSCKNNFIEGKWYVVDVVGLDGSNRKNALCERMTFYENGEYEFISEYTNEGSYVLANHVIIMDNKDTFEIMSQADSSLILDLYLVEDKARFSFSKKKPEEWDCTNLN